MSGKISNIIREYIFGLSIICTIIGLVTLLFGLIGMLMRETVSDMLNVQPQLLDWSFYILAVGFILLIAGIWYLYTFIKDKRFLMEEIQTNKRSEFMKCHGKLQDAARRLPSKYRKMLSEKEASLKIK